MFDFLILYCDLIPGISQIVIPLLYRRKIFLNANCRNYVNTFNPEVGPTEFKCMKYESKIMDLEDWIRYGSV
jgi:hypothetical protein